MKKQCEDKNCLLDHDYHGSITDATDLDHNGVARYYSKGYINNNDYFLPKTPTPILAIMFCFSVFFIIGGFLAGKMFTLTMGAFLQSVFWIMFFPTFLDVKRTKDYQRLIKRKCPKCLIANNYIPIL